MTILAIDPGTTQSALVVWDGKQITDKQIAPNEQILLQLPHCACNRIVIEMVASYGMAVGKEVFETCVWIGRFFQAVDRIKFKESDSDRITLMYRMEVKMHLCHQAKAKDTNIHQALIDRFGGKGTRKNPGLTYGLKKDLWQAFALAVTAYDKFYDEV